MDSSKNEGAFAPVRNTPSFDAVIESELETFEAAEARRLGLADSRCQWRDLSRSVIAGGREAHPIILFGGLTQAHDVLMESGVASLGFVGRALPCPDNVALQYGKEFGNRGQCNPTYFTVGNLLRFLIDLRDQQGMETADIIAKYVFITLGSCGPCRFGMYTTEYRKALRDAGFEGFRVMDIKQDVGIGKAKATMPLPLDARFYLTAIKCVVAGDILNALSYRIRPYEVHRGATDAAVARCLDLLCAAIANRRSLLCALRQCRRELSRVEVDWLRPKPKVAIIGEFWAMTTEGDGNYGLQRFLEAEGAEVEIPLLSTWVLYDIWCVEYDTRERMNLRRRPDDRHRDESESPRKALFLAWLVRRGYEAFFYACARAIGLRHCRLADMGELARASHEYYPNQLRGGEGHLEVGKVIMTVHERTADLVVSVKPFGCMPSSSVSDGIQSLVTAHFPDANFLPIETTGDSAVNAYSRVQMALFKARARAQREVRRALEVTDLSTETASRLIAARPRLRRGVSYPAHVTSVTAANMLYALTQPHFRLGPARTGPPKAGPVGSPATME